MSGFDLAFQIDPLDRVRPAGDTSFALMLEAQARGHRVFWFHPSDLVFDTDTLSAPLRHVRLRDQESDFFDELSVERRDLTGVAAVFIRQDPPFDTAYLANTLLLDLIADRTLILNDPAALRDVSEKLSALTFAKDMPPTLVGRDMDAILAFASNYDEVVVKPLFAGGGEAVSRCASAPDVLTPHIEAKLAANAPEPIMVQAFLPAAPTDGDKRVMFLDGEVVGVLRRIPAEGEFRANIHVGGRAELGELNDAEHDICDKVGGYLRRAGVFYAGIDLLDGRLIEINVTSPTLMRELKRCGGPDVAALYLDRLEAKLTARHAPAG